MPCRFRKRVTAKTDIVSRNAKLLRMEFRTLVNTMMRVPCQIVKTGGRIVSSVLAVNEFPPVFW